MPRHPESERKMTESQKRMLEILDEIDNDDFVLEEYTGIFQECGAREAAELEDALVGEAEWTEEGAKTIVRLAKHYGVFTLRSALAVAKYLDIQDGDCGL